MIDDNSTLGALSQVSDQSIPAPEPSVTVESPKYNPYYELQKSRIAMNEQLKRLQSSLDQRINPPFNEKLMALAEGFLSPTKTGSFGESAGYASKGYREASKAEREQQELDNKLRMELLQQQIAFNQQAVGQDIMQGLIGGKPSGFTGESTQVAGPGATEGSTGVAPTATTSIANTKKALEYAEAVGAPKDVIDMLQKRLDEQRKEIEIEQKEYGTTKTPIPYFGEAVDLTVGQARDIKNLINKTQGMSEDQRRNEFMKYYKSQGIGSFSTEGEKTTFETPSQKTQRQTLETEAGKGVIEQDKKDRAYVYGLRDNANNVISSSDILYKLANNPDTKEAFGILQKSGVINSILGLMQEGIGGDALNIRIHGMEEAIRKMTTVDSQGRPVDPDKLIAAFRTAQQQVANLSLGFARVYLQGQGAVSDNERRLVENMIPNVQDPAASIMLKAEILKARATFDREFGRAASKWIQEDPLHRTVEQFKNIPNGVYDRLVNHLNDQTGEIMQAYFPDQKPSPAANPAAPAESPAQPGSIMDRFQQEKIRRGLT